MRVVAGDVRGETRAHELFGGGGRAPSFEDRFAAKLVGFAAATGAGLSTLRGRQGGRKFRHGVSRSRAAMADASLKRRGTSGCPGAVGLGVGGERGEFRRELRAKAHEQEVMGRSGQKRRGCGFRRGGEAEDRAALGARLAERLSLHRDGVFLVFLENPPEAAPWGPIKKPLRFGTGGAKVV